MPAKKGEATTVPEVLKAITAVTAGLGQVGIAKKGKNKQQNYSFRGIDQVYAALSPLLVQHGLVITPRVLNRIVVERETKAGGVMFNVSLEVEFTFRSSVDGSAITAVTFGECSDAADKATNKAISAAYKYLVFLTFCVPLEGEPDADAEHPEAAPSKKKAEPAAAPEDLKSFEDVKSDISKCGALKHLRNIYKKYVPLFDGAERAELITLCDIRSTEIKEAEEGKE